MGKLCLMSGTAMISLLSVFSCFVNLTTGYQGWNHFICLFTPLTGGTLIKFHRDQEGSAHAAWSIVFDLHRFLDLALHVFFLWHFPWRVDHLASLVSHSLRYLGYPWSAYENIVIGGRVKLEFYVDCIGQFLSMVIWLGWQASVVALFGQLLWRKFLKTGVDLEVVKAGSPHHKWK